ncbi:hypothetical protein AB0D73_27240 [Streptomyces sp. NPDC048215]|uniref:hypothetical protein n=1 Tax=Streptomyces sp. NPDC048215 TaxID=3156690 RepID=UPI003408F385
MSPTPTNPTTTPIDCAEPGCTWAVRGVPDKYARIMARDHAAEHAGQASSTATETAVDRVPLRDRIRRAVCEAEGFAWDTDMLEPDEYGEVADAVMAVLPAPAVDVADLRDRITTAISKWHRDPEQSLYSQGADAVLAVLAAEAQQPAPAVTEEPTPKPPSTATLLADPCDACQHTLNWHRNDVGCTVPRCVCGRFHATEEPK